MHSSEEETVGLLSNRQYRTENENIDDDSSSSVRLGILQSPSPISDSMDFLFHTRKEN